MFYSVCTVLQVEPALMYDSVQVFAKGLLAMEAASVHSPAHHGPGLTAPAGVTPLPALRSSNLSCDMERPWEDGLGLYNYINTVSTVINLHLRLHRFRFNFECRYTLNCDSSPSLCPMSAG